ncbi:hypothetical protein K2173_013931 [Erythroxylum novogranatense]|uniref:Peptidase metallopeptidase domain-containing protein n=1 Tax=Erythroxylum novogranatense TaxID=1862640 RepID=A0AAV8SDB0_9ROSI|nr:hypothetical protein K2173_013931 [Erythroxylum novogranatense]
MAFIAFLLLSFALPALLSQTALAHETDTKSSPFDFLNHLKGCHKGDKLKDIHKLRNYLEHFGYLSFMNSKSTSYATDDDFDYLLERALKVYQHNYHLNASGILDSETVSKMMTPRCGVADIINGTNWMRVAKKHDHRRGHISFHTTAHYSFFPGNRRWPSNQYSLTYGFLQGTPTEAMTAVDRAFRTWQANTHFRFTRTQDYRNANLKISFQSGDHGDGAPFDGPGGTIAHASAPTNGQFHYDASERWSVSQTAGTFDLETVALHEIGHLLGLGHSSVEGAIMYPSIAPGTTKGLHADDIQGIRALYGA